MTTPQPAGRQPSPRFRVRRFLLVLCGLLVLNSAVLLLYTRDAVSWHWVLPFDWPAVFILPDEADEALGPAREALIAWFAAIPWLALCAALAARPWRR
ncbi:MAG TPA: hypothetical protein VOA87_03975 [Thermoanaerobaculia bacterium]|nr:hypothetical protein [Thermoanaerobaculia bacterium]